MAVRAIRDDWSCQRSRGRSTSRLVLAPARRSAPTAAAATAAVAVRHRHCVCTDALDHCGVSQPTEGSPMRSGTVSPPPSPPLPSSAISSAPPAMYSLHSTDVSRRCRHLQLTRLAAAAANVMTRCIHLATGGCRWLIVSALAACHCLCTRPPVIRRCCRPELTRRRMRCLAGSWSPLGGLKGGSSRLLRAS